jgi:hypothetical protein
VVLERLILLPDATPLLNTYNELHGSELSRYGYKKGLSAWGVIRAPCLNPSVAAS